MLDFVVFVINCAIISFVILYFLLSMGHEEPIGPTSPDHSEQIRSGDISNSRSPRTSSQASSAQATYQDQFLEIAEAMAFSDAEEDQPTSSNVANEPSEPSMAIEPESNGIEQNGASYSDNEPSSSQASTAEPQPSTSNSSSNSAKDTEVNDGNDKEKLTEKLLQVQNYIKQTNQALKSCEDQSTPAKKDQYNTLVKVLKDLKNSEANLLSRLNEFQDGREQGSQKVGVVGSMNEVVNPLSMNERLARHETEQSILSARLRENVAKREALFNRYKNTRERLNNLKKQRRDIMQDERRVLQEQGGAEDPYDDEQIPEAEAWTVEQVEENISMFEGLKEKAESLGKLYETQKRVTDPNETETIANISTKMKNVEGKKLKIAGILRKLQEILERKRSERNDQIANGISSDVSSLESPEEPNIEDNDGASDDLARAVAAGNLLSEQTDLIMQSTDAQAKMEHLNKLKGQLSEMKKMLDSTKAIREQNFAELQRRQKQISIPSGSSGDEVANGISSSEYPSQDPKVVAKYQEIAKARQRLAKMEEITELIAAARDQGRPLAEVLSEEDMAILEDAKNDVDVFGDSEPEAAPAPLGAKRKTTPVRPVSRRSPLNRDLSEHSDKEQKQVNKNVLPNEDWLRQHEEMRSALNDLTRQNKSLKDAMERMTLSKSQRKEQEWDRDEHLSKTNGLQQSRPLYSQYDNNINSKTNSGEGIPNVNWNRGKEQNDVNENFTGTGNLLRTLQTTVNSLCESIGQNAYQQQQVLQNGPQMWSFNQPSPGGFIGPQPGAFGSSYGNYPPMAAVAPQYPGNSQQLNPYDMQRQENTNHQMMNGIQQCLSQLNRQSMEIQCIAKHLQVRPNPPPLSFPPYPFYPYWPS